MSHAKRAKRAYNATNKNRTQLSHVENRINNHIFQGKPVPHKLKAHHAKLLRQNASLYHKERVVIAQAKR